MSPRTLTAGEKTPTPAPVRWTDDVIAIVWSCVTELWDAAAWRWWYGEHIASLDKKLDDPALANHPKRPAAMAKFYAYKAEITGIDAKAERLQDNLAKHWDRLPELAKRELAALPGWEELWREGERGVELATAVWRRANDRTAMPQGEPPF